MTDSDEKLWQAMLALWEPVGAGLEPHGRAHLVQEHATALLGEWELATKGATGRKQHPPA